MTPLVIEPVQLGTSAAARRTKARRAVQIQAAVGRHLVPVLARTRRLDKDERQRRLGVALAAMSTELGITFVKLAQLLASSPSLVGPALSDSLRSVLDDGPAAPVKDVINIIERDLGRPLMSIYETFEPKPFAAASLAVVHRATMRDGRQVAVKVIRPGSREIVAADMSLLQPLARWLSRQVPLATTLSLPASVDALADQLSEELDLRNEARAMRWFSSMTELIGAQKVFAPSPVDEASGQQVLTMEYVEGTTIDDLETLTASGIDTRGAVEALIESWFALTLCAGIFHGDMHAGNLLLTADGRVAVLDWGIVGRLPEASRTFFRRSLEGALGDETAWPEVFEHMRGSVDLEAMKALGIGEEEFLALIRAQTTMIMTSPFSELNLAMLFPTAQPAPGGPAVSTPTTARGWLRLLRSERRRIRDSVGPLPGGPDRGDLMLIKQLVFFERYGKMFLGDRPLIYDPDVYRELLARPDLTG